MNSAEFNALAEQSVYGAAPLAAAVAAARLLREGTVVGVRSGMSGAIAEAELVRVLDDGSLRLRETARIRRSATNPLLTRDVAVSEVVALPKTKFAAAQRRDRGNGRYKHDGNWDRLCVCGHTLGIHAAERVRGEQPCFVGDDGVTQCDCESFKASRKK